MNDANAALSRNGSPSSIVAETRDSAFDYYSIYGALEEFNEQGIKVVVYAGTSGNLASVKPFIDENGMLLINNTSTVPDLAVDDTIYRLVPDDTFMASAIADRIFNQGKDRLIILYRSDAWGANLAQYAKTSFESLGGTVTDSIV